MHAAIRTVGATGVMIPLMVAAVDSVTVLGAHCDDIAIGVGGTLLLLCRNHPGLQIDALVLTGRGTPREAEEHAALAAFCPDAKLRVTVLDLPDGHLPGHGDATRNAMESFCREANPDLVFAPHRRDTNHDHRVLAELAPTTFRDHLVLGYEIVTWDGDLTQPPVYQPLSPAVAEQKAELLYKHYPSQRERHWFDQETFLGLARLRGAQCQRHYAEAFHADKLILDLGG